MRSVSVWKVKNVLEKGEVVHCTTTPNGLNYTWNVLKMLCLVMSVLAQFKKCTHLWKLRV